MSFKNFLTFREVFSLDGSCIKVVGTPIFLANNFRDYGNYPFDFISTAAYYKSLIGILRWIVDLGRVDVCTEVSLLAKCLFLP